MKQEILTGFFAPFPLQPKSNESSTLNFSILDKYGDNIPVFSTLTIKDQASGEIIDQVPYKLYEFSDITFPYTFKKDGKYEIQLETRTNGHEKYFLTPITTSFNLDVGQKEQSLIPFDSLMLYYVIPAASAIAAVFVLLWTRRKRRN